MSAESSGIVLNIDVPDDLALSLSDSELVSLFANLLDNAREACVRCSGKMAYNAGQRPREISIAITSTGNDMCIAVVNSKPSDEHPNVKDIKTSKPDKENHGFGVAIIRSIVAKYGGVMQMSDGGDVFRVEINIPGI